MFSELSGRSALARSCFCEEEYERIVKKQNTKSVPGVVVVVSVVGCEGVTQCCLTKGPNRLSSRSFRML